jgi:hypothetical protein
MRTHLQESRESLRRMAQPPHEHTGDSAALARRPQRRQPEGLSPGGPPPRSRSSR